MQASQPVPSPHAILNTASTIVPGITSSPKVWARTPHLSSTFFNQNLPSPPLPSPLLQSCQEVLVWLGLGFHRGFCRGFSWCVVVSRAWSSPHIALPPHSCDYRDGFLVWVETQVLGAKEFAAVVKEWHVSLHCHSLFKFLLLAKYRQPLMFFFPPFCWDLFGHYRHHCHAHSFGFENPVLGWAGLGSGVIVPFYGLLLRGFGMGFVRWCIGNVQHHSSYAHLSSELLRNPTLLVP